MAFRRTNRLDSVLGVGASRLMQHEPRKQSTAARGLLWPRTASAAVLAIAALCSGCVESLPYSQLPELAKDPRPVLTPDQQKAAAADLGAQKGAKRDAAIKEIEQKR